MNPVFWLLVALAAVILWICISFIFIPLGRAINKKMSKISDIINYEEESKECEEE